MPKLKKLKKKKTTSSSNNRSSSQRQDSDEQQSSTTERGGRSQNDDTVLLVVKNGIQELKDVCESIFDKYEKKRKHSVSQLRQKRIKHIIKHWEWCTKTILNKQRSYRIGFNCLSTIVWPRIQSNIKSMKVNNPKQYETKMTSILQHLFIQLLRFHDGLVLLESGECRHPGDVKWSRSSKYQSHLLGGGSSRGGGGGEGTNNEAEEVGTTVRGDGYTRLYSNDRIYSGAAWDEINDPMNGLKTRLCNEISGLFSSSSKTTNDLWEKYFDNKPNIENLINQIESNQPSTRKFTTFSEQVRDELRMALLLQQQQQQQQRAVSVKLSLADKMERLSVSVGNTFSLTIKRMANNFSLRNDPYGVLPPYYTIDEWETILQLPPPPPPVTKAAPTATISSDNPTNNNNNDKKQAEESNNSALARAADKTKIKKKKQRLAIGDSSSSSSSGEPAASAKPARTNNQSIQALDAKAAKPKKQVGSTAAPPPPPPSSLSSSGLVVQVTHNNGNQDTNTKKKSPSSSLNAIKQQFGVNVQALEASRDCAEAEEETTKRTARHEEFVDYQQHHNSHDYGAEHEEEDVSFQLQEATRALKQRRRWARKAWYQYQDEFNDIYQNKQSWWDVTIGLWDAQECFREAAMHAGNCYLSSSHREDLQRATKCFEESKSAVNAQEVLHKKMFLNLSAAIGSNLKCLSIEESESHRRDLKLLLGQAHVNAAIAKIDLIEFIGKNTGEWKVLVRDAERELNDAEKCAEIFRELAETDRNKGHSYEETGFDIQESKKLQCLVLRSRGDFWWRQGEINEAIRCYESVFAKDWGFGQGRNDGIDSIFIDYRLQIFAERYRAATTLAHLLVDNLEQAKVDSIRKDTIKYDARFECVCKCIETSSLISDDLQECLQSLPVQDAQQYQFFSEEQGILQSDELIRSLQDIRDWWEAKKSQSLSTVPLPERNILPNGRNDLRTVDNIHPHRVSATIPPPKRFVLDDARRRDNKKKRRGPSYGSCHNNNHNDSGGPYPSSPTDVRENLRHDRGNTSRKYRKWGDELLGLSTTINSNGREVPKLVYPSVAPEMPAEIKAKLQQNVHNRNHVGPIGYY